ncbi:MAG: DUF349 domain-containing protein [Erysipelotrichaceae bacterium]|nr:DUF349 domain-containing protein [Erysipelotrichaceae bacterium]
MFNEIIDQEEDINLRKQLIEEVKNIPSDADWNTVSSSIQNLKRRWKRINYWESAYEDTLEEEFEAAIDVLYGKRNQVMANSKALKEELIVRAEALSQSNNFNSTTNELNELLNQWKAAGSCGKETDDQLWEKFNAARQTFFDRKHDYWQARQEKSANAKTAKEELIKKAEALKDSTDWKKTADAYNELLNQWKTAGFAGKDQDDALWARFNEARQAFYDARSAHYDAQRAENAKRAEAKAELVKAAQAIADEKFYSRENSDKIKKLNAEWKTIGFAGKGQEDELWSQFRAAADSYFEGLKQYNQSRHDQWMMRMQENRNRKLDLIQKQKNQLKRMEQELGYLLSQSAVDEMKEDIEDKKDFIAQLEEELAELDKRIAE